MNNAPISLIQISRALSISAGTLSNWQKRYEGFPEPASSIGRRRLYRMADIQEFMARHDLKAGDANLSEQRKVSNEQRFVNYLSNELRGNHAMGPDFVLAIAATGFRIYPQLHQFKKNHGVPHSIDQDLALGTEILNRGQTNDATLAISDWKDLPSSLDPVEFANALRLLLRKISGRQFGGEYTTSISVSRLLHEITHGLEVLDMCSGYGNLLRENHRGSGRLVGQEINPAVAAISRVLAFLEGYKVEIHTEDALATCHNEWLQDGFFAVVADPPMGIRAREDQINPNDLRWKHFAQSKTNQTDDFWIQSALAYLRPSTNELNFRAALHLRSGWFFDGNEGPMRDTLLRSSVIEAVIALGNGTSAGSGIATNILVLRKTGVVSTKVRMIDAREAGHLVNGQRSFTNDEINSIVAALNGEGTSGQQSVIRVLDVPVLELLQNGSVLNVGRYITDAQQVASLDDSIRSFDEAIGSLKTSLSQLGRVLNEVTANPLAQAENRFKNELALLPMNSKDLDDYPVVSLFKNRMQGSEWTRDEILDDDVVVCTAGSQVGQALTGNEIRERNVQWSKVWILRVRSRHVDPRYLATWAKYGGLELQIRSLVSGSTIPTLTKRDLERVEVPVPSIETQMTIATWGDMVTAMAAVFKNFGNTQNEFLTSIQNLGASFFSDLQITEER